MKNNEVQLRRWFLFAVAAVGILLGILTFTFVNEVRDQLWEQSVGTIIESTRQGENALNIQLREDFSSIVSIKRYLEKLPADARESVMDIVTEFSKMENGVSLYLQDGTCVPEKNGPDQYIADQFLMEYGIVNPHISSSTGVNVFDFYTQVKLADGSINYLVKEYNVAAIAGEFSLSFYNNAGFSYIINTGGDVLIRSPHPGSNKTVKNIFDMLPAGKNDSRAMEEFRQALVSGKSGWAVFAYGDADAVFCYVPMKGFSDWYLLSIIPEKVVSAQTYDILRRTIFFVAAVSLAIIMLALVYILQMKRTYHKLRTQAAYIDHLYNAVPEGVALISRDTPFRFIQINHEGLRLLNYPEYASNDALREKSSGS